MAHYTRFQEGVFSLPSLHDIRLPLRPTYPLDSPNCSKAARLSRKIAELALSMRTREPNSRVGLPLPSGRHYLDFQKNKLAPHCPHRVLQNLTTICMRLTVAFKATFHLHGSHGMLHDPNPQVCYGRKRQRNDHAEILIHVHAKFRRADLIHM